MSVCVEGKVSSSILGITSLALVMGDMTNMAGWGERAEFLVTDQNMKDLIFSLHYYSIETKQRCLQNF